MGKGDQRKKRRRERGVLREGVARAGHPGNSKVGRKALVAILSDFRSPALCPARGFSVFCFSLMFVFRLFLPFFSTSFFSSFFFSCCSLSLVAYRFLLSLIFP